jgi:hypothetical protein
VATIKSLRLKHRRNGWHFGEVNETMISS